MNTEMIENMNKMGKTTYNAVKELYDINMKMVGQVYEQQMAIMNLGMEYTTSNMEMLGKSKGYKDVVSGQTALISETSEKVQGIARNTVDIMNESNDEVSAWVEKGVEDAANIIPMMKKSA